MPVLEHEKPKSRVSFACERIKETALRLGPGGKLPTVREFRRTLGLGMPTIMDALWDLERAGVIDRKHGSGIYVSPRILQKNIGLVFGRQAFGPGTSPFCAMIVDYCEKRAQSRGEAFSFYLDVSQGEAAGGGPVHADLIDALSKNRLNGLLLVARHSEAQEAWLRAQGVPLVNFAGGVLPPYLPDNVSFDLLEMATLAAESLKAKGCRHIGMITPSDKGESTFLPAFKSLSLPIRADWVVNTSRKETNNQTRMQMGHGAMRELLSTSSKKMDGVIVLDDMLATGAIAAIQDARMVVGRDLLVATHANKGSAVLESDQERLILVEVDPSEIVESMFDLIEVMMNGRRSNSRAVVVHSRVRPGSLVESLRRARH